MYEYEDDGTVGDITVPDTVEHDGKIYPVTAIYATLWYSGITGVIIGKNVADINDYVFTSDGITHIDVSEENQCYSSVDGVLFSKNGMSLIKYPCGRADETYTVPATVASLDPHSFDHTNIREVVLNDGLVRIGVEAFSNCTNLEHVNSSIGIDTMPSTVAMIADRAFIRCESLREIPIASGIEVVGTASDGKEAAELCEKLSPDVAIMDMRMPGYDGEYGIRRIKENCPSVRILVLTTFDDSETVQRAVASGADGYILKEMDNENEHHGDDGGLRCCAVRSNRLGEGELEGSELVSDRDARGRGEGVDRQNVERTRAGHVRQLERALLLVP